MTLQLVVSKGEDVILMATLQNAVVEEMNGVISVLADGPFYYDFARNDVVNDIPDDDRDEYVYELSDGRVITITYSQEE